MNVSNVIGCALRIAKFGVRSKREERVKIKKKKKGNRLLEFTPYFAREYEYFRMVRISTASKASDCNSTSKSKQIEPREKKRKQERTKKKTVQVIVLMITE